MVRTTRPTRTPARNGFTLIELIVVIGIILALVSLSVAGIMKALNYQQRRNTETVVSKVDPALQKMWLRTIDTAKSESSDAGRLAANNPIAWALSNSDPRRAQVIHILMCLKREFPTSFAEAVNPCPGVGTFSSFAPNRAYVTALTGKSAASLARSPEDQTSACLYMALKQSRRGQDFDPDTSLSSQEVVDPFNDGVKEIYDAWGKPVSFIRWPSVPLLSSSTVGTLQTFSVSNPPDKEDPEGLLSQNWWTWVMAQPAPIPAQAVQLFSVTAQTFPYPLYPVDPPGAATAGMQYRLTPVILSKGSDGKLGTSDDIFNFDLNP